MLPRNQVAVSSWPNADEAFKEIAREIRAIVEALRRWVVLACSPDHQPMLTRLANDLEIHHIPASTHTDQTKLSDAIRLSSAVILLTSPVTCFSQIDREVMVAYLRHFLPEQNICLTDMHWLSIDIKKALQRFTIVYHPALTDKEVVMKLAH
jgi:hypothetical protein